MMQNQNGPCPLLALANILLLRNQINLSPDASSVTQVRLSEDRCLQKDSPSLLFLSLLTVLIDASSIRDIFTPASAFGSNA